MLCATALSLRPLGALIAHGAIAAVQKVCKVHPFILITVEWPRIHLELELSIRRRGIAKTSKPGATRR